MAEAAEFTVFAPNQEPVAITALSETLSPKKPELVRVAKTAQEALKSGEGVLVLFLDRRGAPNFGAEALPELKKMKIIGIGYGAADLFGSLRLEINDGACAHGTAKKSEIVMQRNALSREQRQDTIKAFQPAAAGQETSDAGRDYIFAMYLPPKAKACKFVEAIARWRGAENYAPIVRQGNYMMVGLAAPATQWTTEYKAFFSTLANNFAKTALVPYSVAKWEVTRPGEHAFELAPLGRTDELSREEFYFRFTKPTRFSAVLKHTGSKQMMMMTRGPGERYGVRKDATRGEVLRVQADISEDDVKDAGDDYWLLEVVNFDRNSRAKCKLLIEYTAVP